ncbi:hypothetical protein [uncultured Shimia sp.]|uniref:hypothetical protein n=1 Tax=uncultured Shimia sp. TaxID=573152 RepID=UPI003429E368
MGERPHGFRSSFRDWRADATEVPREVAETALGRVVGGDEADGAAQQLTHSPKLHQPSPEDIEAAAARLKTPGAALLIGDSALFGPLRELAGKIAAATGCRLLADTLIPRISRGAGAAKLDQ